MTPDRLREIGEWITGEYLRNNDSSVAQLLVELFDAQAALCERYRWRPITELHEDYGDCVLINVADCGDIEIGSNLDSDFDISRWTHFSQIAPLSGDDYDRMVVDALEPPR